MVLSRLNNENYAFREERMAKKKYSLKEEHVIDYPFIIQIDKGRLVRDAAGAWRCEGTASLQVDLPDGRQIWGIRPFKLVRLTQKGRRPYPRARL